MVKVPVIVKFANYYGKIYVIRKMILSYGFYQDFRAIYVHLVKKKAWLFWDLNVCKVFESTTNWIMGSGNEFYGEKACSELADFYKEYSQKKNRYVSVSLWRCPCGTFGLEESLKLKCFDYE